MCLILLVGELVDAILETVVVVVDGIKNYVYVDDSNAFTCCKKNFTSTKFGNF